jgi:hypothetical protein
LPLHGRLQPLLHELRADPGDGRGAGGEGLGAAVVGPAGARGVGLQQQADAEDRCRRPLAGGREPFQLVALCGGQADDKLLLQSHDDSPRWGGKEKLSEPLNQLQWTTSLSNQI